MHPLQMGTWFNQRQTYVVARQIKGCATEYEDLNLYQGRATYFPFNKVQFICYRSVVLEVPR